MKLLRTPDERFKNLPDYPFKPNYLEIDGIRIHYVDEGSKNAEETILLMHGEPTWSFLYRHMIPPLIDAGYRTIAPDLVGFGKSDKPAEKTDHAYAKHVGWITNFVKALELHDITMFCQDWGSLIGLRVAIANEEIFKRIILSNGGLPSGEQRMRGAFYKWLELSRTTPIFETSVYIQDWTETNLTEDVLRGYEAPFPEEKYKEGARILPSLVPITIDDPEHDANSRAYIKFKSWTKPFLTAYADGDKITGGAEKRWIGHVPGANGQNHVIVEKAGHFIQEDKGLELAEIIKKFIIDNP